MDKAEIDKGVRTLYLMKEKMGLTNEEIKNAPIKVQQFAFHCGHLLGTEKGLKWGFLIGFVLATGLFYLLRMI